MAECCLGVAFHKIGKGMMMRRTMIMVIMMMMMITFVREGRGGFFTGLAKK